MMIMNVMMKMIRCRQVHKITSYFQETDIAHNLFICRGIVFGEKRGSAKTTVRVFIWPRRKFVGMLLMLIGNK